MFPSALPQTLPNTHPFLFLQSISAVLLKTVTSFSLAVWVQEKKRKTLEYIMTEMEAFL